MFVCVSTNPPSWLLGDQLVRSRVSLDQKHRKIKSYKYMPESIPLMGTLSVCGAAQAVEHAMVDLAGLLEATCHLAVVLVLLVSREAGGGRQLTGGGGQAASGLRRGHSAVRGVVKRLPEITYLSLS